MRFLITGATGYIGQRLLRAARSHGHEVIVASRKNTAIALPADSANTATHELQHLHFDLLSPHPIPLPEGINVVFHLAAITAAKDSNPQSEIQAASYLMQAAEQSGAKVIFVSSQSSRADAPTDYGRTKWQIEQLTFGVNGCVVRPGQVYGAFETGLFGILVKLVRKVPCIPAFVPSPTIQPVHVDDLVAALLNCAVAKNLDSAVLNIGAISPVTFTHFLHSISQHWVRQKRILFPIPVFFVKAVITAVGTSLRTKLGLERLNSLFDLQPMNTRDDLQRIGITLRPLASGMSRSGSLRRRTLAKEGRAFMHYVLKFPPSIGLIRRYIISIELLRNGHALGIHPHLLHRPTLLALIDSTKHSPTEQDDELTWRLNTAMVLAEASTLGAQSFLGIGKRSGFFMSALGVSHALVTEIFWRVALIMYRPFFKTPFIQDRATLDLPADDEQPK